MTVYECHCRLTSTTDTMNTASNGVEVLWESSPRLRLRSRRKLLPRKLLRGLPRIVFSKLDLLSEFEAYEGRDSFSAVRRAVVDDDFWEDLIRKQLAIGNS